MNDNVNKKPWTHEEIKILRELYVDEKIPWVQILDKLPNRTLASCRLMAERLRLKRAKKILVYQEIRNSARWAEVEKEILKSHPDLLKTKEGQRLIHNQVLSKIVRERNPNLSEEKISELIGKLMLKSEFWAGIVEDRRLKQEEYSKSEVGRRLLKFERTGKLDLE